MKILEVRPERHVQSRATGKQEVILQHAGPQPFLDEPHDTPVCYPMLNEFHKPLVGEPIEEGLDIRSRLATIRPAPPLLFQNRALSVSTKSGEPRIGR